MQNQHYSLIQPSPIPIQYWELLLTSLSMPDTIHMNENNKIVVIMDA